MASNVSMPIGVSCADVGTFSAHEMATGRGGGHRQISPIKGQIAIYRPRIGPDSLRDAFRATFISNPTGVIFGISADSAILPPVTSHGRIMVKTWGLGAN